MAEKRLELSMLGGTEITAEHLAIMFERLTGRAPSPKEIAEAQQKLKQAYAEQAKKASQ